MFMKYRRFHVCLLLLLLSLYGFSYANESDTAQKSIEDSAEQLEDSTDNSLDEIDGLIIDHTMTRIGSMFYSEFSQQMNDAQENLRENLTITEKTTAKFGTIITVWHLRKVVFRTSLSPKMKESEEQAAAAVKQVKDYLTKWKIQRLYSDTFDLARDEL